jgi:L-threonylcarbamoyladenylate synthase
MNTELGTNISKAAALLTADELVAIPTETVYGLAGNALSEIAVSKIYAAKNRPSFNPLILHVSGINQLSKYALVDSVSALLAKEFMPGPITLLLPKKNIVPDITTAGSNKVALRVPQHPLCLELLHSIDFPLAAPSANISGYISPTTAAHVAAGLNGKIPYILNGGTAAVGLESTICEVMHQKIIIHRTGGISANELQRVSALEVVLVNNQKSVETAGQLKSHYAPNTPLYRGDIADIIARNSGKKIACISFQKRYDGVENFVLSPSGNLAEAANLLFATLRLVDAGNFDLICTELFPNEGIGPAINDRLGRAQFLYK